MKGSMVIANFSAVKDYLQNKITLGHNQQFRRACPDVDVPDEIFHVKTT